MADDVGSALSDRDAEGVVTALVSMTVEAARDLEEESARWGLNRSQMLGIAFGMWMVFQQYQANGLQLIVVGPDGELTPIGLAAGTKAPACGYWPFGHRPPTSDRG